MDFFSCRNLSKSFGKEKVLENVNLSFPSKGIVSIIGPSGCGKSTLFNCLLGLDECNGTITFKNKKIEDFSKFRNKYTGVIFQNFHLFEYLSVEENIKLFPKNKKYLEIVKMLGLENKLKMKVSLLSGGEKQRVAIARTLLKRPKIIFCDEITGSLDEENQEIIMDYLKEISKEILVINISHNEYLVNKYSDHIISYHNHTFNFDSLFDKEENVTSSKKKISFSNLFVHSVNLMHKSMFKIVLSIMSLTISFFLSGSIISINRSLSQYFEKYKMACLDYNFIELSKNTKVKIPNTSFSLVKQSRPDQIEEIKEYTSSCTPCFNYSNLINSYTSLKCGNRDLFVNFYPTENIHINTYNKVIINSKMQELLDRSSIHYINRRTIDYIGTNNQIISDNFTINIKFQVVSVNDEMSLFQEPSIYYSYTLMENFLKTIYLTNISNYFKKTISLQERVAKYYYDGDFYNTGSIYLRCNKKKEVEKVIEKVDGMKRCDYFYSLNSRSLNNYKNYNRLLESIINVIEIFLTLSLVTSLSLLILCINALIIDEEKEIGIFKGLGILDEQVFKIILMQVVLILSFSLILAFFFKSIFYIVLSIKFNFLNLLDLRNILYENLIINLFVFVVFLALSLVCKILIERINISRVLRED